MDERMRFVIRLKNGESMAGLCREFGISRKTGYKIFEECGLEGVEAAIVTAEKEKPHWGAGKIRERLLRRLPHAIKIPAASTVHAVLDRHGLVARLKRSRTRTEGMPLSEGLNPNDLWSTGCPVRFSQRTLKPFQAFGVVAAVGHLNRTDPARTSSSITNGLMKLSA